MAMFNILFSVVCSLLVFHNVGYGESKALNEFINYYEPVFFDGDAKWDFVNNDFNLAKEGADAPSIAKDIKIGSELTERIDIRAFGRVFQLELNRNVTILSHDANVIIMGGKESCITEKMEPKTIIDNLVEGKVIDEPTSFVHGVLIKGVFTGVIHLKNQTLFVERASKYFRDRMPFDCVIFRQEDLNMTAVDCEVGPEGYKCDPIRLLHRRGPGVEQVLSLARSERSWFKRKTMPKTTCTLKVIADHLFTKHAGDGSATGAIYEMIFHVQEADHIYRKTDFNQDGAEDNVGFKIHEVIVQSSTTCLENRAFMKPKLTSDQYLEIFSEYDFENYCVGIAFSGYTFPGRILGIAWMADADESGYVGGICEPRLFSTQDQKALSFNSAVITMMLQGRRMPRGITAIAVAHELGHSFGSDHDPNPDDKCSPNDSEGGRYIMAAVAVKGDQPNNRFFSPCSIGNMKTVLRKKGNCFISLSKKLCCDEMHMKDNTDGKDNCCLNWLEENSDFGEQNSKGLEEFKMLSADEKYQRILERTSVEAESKDKREKKKPRFEPTTQDAEPTAQDAGPTAQDAGPTAQDAGPTAQDAGPTAQDAEPIAQDATPTAQDAAPTAQDADINKTKKRGGKKPGIEHKKKAPPKHLKTENDSIAVEEDEEEFEEDEDEEYENEEDDLDEVEIKSSNVRSELQGRRKPQTECLGPDQPNHEDAHFSCSTAQCSMYGQVSCECPDAQTACVVCCKETEMSAECIPIRRKDTPWWLLRRPGEPCNGDTGKCDTHGRCSVDKTDPLDPDRISKVVESKIENPFDGPTSSESKWKLDPIEQAGIYLTTIRYSLEWFCEIAFRVLWLFVSVLFFLFIVLFICFVCPAVAVGIWCLQQCTCWSASNSIHDDDMFLVVDESDENYFKLAPQAIVVAPTSQCPFPEIKTRSRTL